MINLVAHIALTPETAQTICRVFLFSRQGFGHDSAAAAIRQATEMRCVKARFALRLLYQVLVQYLSVNSQFPGLLISCPDFDGMRYQGDSLSSFLLVMAIASVCLANPARPY